jgi:hypothetical protein
MKIKDLEKEIYSLGYREDDDDRKFEQMMGNLSNHITANNKHQKADQSKIYDTLNEDI